MALTSKQEQFCRNIVSGMNNKEAYQAAYNSASDNAAWIESTKLLSRDDIQEKIKALCKPIELKAQTTALSDREKKRDFLWNVIKDGTQSMGDRLRAVDLLSKIDNEYTGQTIKTDATITFDGLDLDVLKTLSE